MMTPVDIESMPPAQAAAWRRLWRILLAPESTQRTRSRDSLATSATTGETATVKTATTCHHTTDRGERNGA
jgi:hypothetical protein